MCKLVKTLSNTSCRLPPENNGRLVRLRLKDLFPCFFQGDLKTKRRTAERRDSHGEDCDRESSNSESDSYMETSIWDERDSLHWSLITLSLWCLLYQTFNTYAFILEHFSLAIKFLRIGFNYPTHRQHGIQLYDSVNRIPTRSVVQDNGR